MAKNTQQPEVSTSSEAPAETKVVKVTINGQVKDVTCKLVKSGLYSNNSYAYEGEDGNVLLKGTRSSITARTIKPSFKTEKERRLTLMNKVSKLKNQRRSRI